MSGIAGNNLNFGSINGIVLARDSNSLTSFRDVTSSTQIGFNPRTELHVSDLSTTMAINALAVAVAAGAANTRYKIFSVSLTGLQADVAVGLAAGMFPITGKSMTVINLTGNATIKINSPGNDSLALVAGMVIDNLTMTEIYISNAAQIGKVADLWVQGN